jgi:hypothetical protein
MFYGNLELKGVSRNSVEGICCICRRKEEQNHIPKCEGIRVRRKDILEKRFRKTDADMGVRW